MSKFSGLVNKHDEWQRVPITSGFDVTPSPRDEGGAAGISSVKLMQPCTSLKDDCSFSAAGFGKEPWQHTGAKIASTIYFRQRRPLLHNRLN